MSKVIYDVTVSFLVDATNEQNAKDLVRQFLQTPYLYVTNSLDYNWMIHNAEQATGHISLEELRRKAKGGGRI